MANDIYTELNPGQGGSKMDESEVNTSAGSGLHRARVVVGDDAGNLATVTGGKLDVNATVSVASPLEVDQGAAGVDPWAVNVVEGGIQPPTVDSGNATDVVTDEFIGTPYDVSAFNSARISVESDDTWLLDVEWSTDNVTWNIGSSFEYEGTNFRSKAQSFDIAHRAKWFRVHFYGSLTATFLRIRTTHLSTPGQIIFDLVQWQDHAAQFDALPMQGAVLFGKNTGASSGAAIELAASSQGYLRVTGAGLTSASHSIPINDANQSISVDDGGGSLTTDFYGQNIVGSAYDPHGVTVLGVSNVSTGNLVVGDLQATPIATDLSGAVYVVSRSLLDVSVATSLPAGTNNIGDVDIATVPAPLSTSGNGTAAAALRVTIASDTTGVVAVTDNGGSLTVDGTVTVSSVGGTVTVAGTVAVSSLPSIPAGNNNIGDVDIVTVPAPLSTTGNGTAATALRVTIASDTTGVVAVTDNTGSLTVDTPQLPNALVGGRLDVNVGAALPAGTNNIGDVDVLTVPAPLSTTGNGTATTALRVTIASDTTGVVAVTDNLGSLTVDTPQLPGALVGGRLDVNVGAALPAGTNNIGDVDVLTVPAPLSTTGNGTAATALRVTIASDTTGVVAITAASLPLPADASTLTEQQTQTAALATLATEASLAKLTLTPGSTSAAATGPMVQGVVTDAPGTFLDGEIRPLSMNPEGYLRVITTASLRDRVDFFGDDVADYINEASLYQQARSNRWF